MCNRIRYTAWLATSDGEVGAPTHCVRTYTGRKPYRGRLGRMPSLVSIHLITLISIPSCWQSKRIRNSAVNSSKFGLKYPEKPIDSGIALQLL